MEKDSQLKPRLVMHIGRKRALPTACPICGVSTEIKPCDPPAAPVTLRDIFKAHYSRPWNVYSREVEGWKGYVTWYFDCTHIDPIAYQLLSEPTFLSRIGKQPTWDGGSFTIPIRGAPR